MAIAAIEPMGPLFADVPGFGSLGWGLTAHRIGYEPARDDPREVRKADLATLRIPALEGKPVLVVGAGSSTFTGFTPGVADFLDAAGGGHCEYLRLPDHGVTGNGHGLILEANSDRTVLPVIEWITDKSRQLSTG
jgi:hypothetical protein